MRYLPNVLTITRIVITPLMLVLLMSNTLVGQVWAFVLFVIAAVSDYLDGKLARSYKARSRLGQFLDPLADKVLVLGTFAALAYLIPAVIPWWAVALIALRDLTVTVLRTWAESRGRSIRTLKIAKSKTVVQLVYLIIVLLLLAGAKAPGSVGRLAARLLHSPIPFVVLLGVVAFTVITGILYLLRQEYNSSPKLNG
ncbi:MAG TPA: CDP-diacylglycerol--glycerol-3-phosphate 3-phosphatidyltransferase [Rhodothermales bacterium]|nr:CDP-diacylglycerol--glycerol-3-phosphate 3-phosphatidyltransferase [Rhodothermales bacterium]